VIAGAMTPEQVDSNVVHGTTWKLTPDEMAAVPSVD
jgi:hypothetical protein